MGLIGAGAIKGMQASLKLNKAQLKKKRLSAKEIAERIPAKGNLSNLNQNIDPEKLAAFNAKMEKQRKKQRNLKVICFSALIIGGITVFVLLFI